MYTLPPLFWFLDICFSNSFSAVAMPMSAPHNSPASPPAPLLLRRFLSLCEVCRHSPVGQTKLRPSFLSQSPDLRPQETLERFHHPVSQTLKVSKPADQKTIRKTSLSLHFQQQQSPKCHTRKLNCLRWAETAFCRRWVLGCTSRQLSTELIILKGSAWCNAKHPPNRMAIASAFFSLLWPFRFHSSDEHRHVSECAQTSTWVNPGSPHPQLPDSGQVTYHGSPSVSLSVKQEQQ